MNADELFEEAKKLYRGGKNQEVIALLSDDTLIRLKSAALYGWRGMAKDNLKQYKEAIKDYDSAILINPSVINYYNRGYSKDNLGLYKEAIKDYNKAIKLAPKDADIYNNRGVSKRALGQNKQAIKDFNKSIKLNPNNPRPYTSMGLAYIELNDYDTAIANFQKALTIDPNFIRAKINLEEARALLGKKLDKEEKDALETFGIIAGLVEGLDERQKILRDSNNIIKQCILPIVNSFIETKVPHVVHYSKLPVAYLLIDKPGSKLRYYNAAYMNDPEEGEIIFHFLKKDTVKNAFKEGKNGEQSNFYLGSFLPADMKDKTQSHDDDLVMWRTYGKDDQNNEACGCSIVVKSGLFDFTQPTDGESKTVQGSGKDGEEINEQQQNKERLYKVIYYNKRKNEFEREGLKPEEIKTLNTQLETLEAALEKLLTDYPQHQIIINKIIYHILSEIRYLFKAADYYFENELRVIKFANYESDAVQPDERKKLYIQSKTQVRPHITRIVLGPKVKEPEMHLYLPAVMAKAGYKIELKESDCEFK